MSTDHYIMMLYCIPSSSDEEGIQGILHRRVVGQSIAGAALPSIRKVQGWGSLILLLKWLVAQAVLCVVHPEKSPGIHSQLSGLV